MGLNGLPGFSIEEEALESEKGERFFSMSVFVEVVVVRWEDWNDERREL